MDSNRHSREGGNLAPMTERAAHRHSRESENLLEASLPANGTYRERHALPAQREPRPPDGAPPRSRLW